ncbi:MAG: hypothetical protein DRI69_04410 [Bacteroidetes bacterium]|nr:MAG: hypothetical protein DRI69_04410 [Bacteroidota bacterium]
MKYHIVIMIFASLVIQAANLNATNYFVSNSGSDSNSGMTPSTPFLTIQKAANVVSTGDTVFVESGTYAGFDLRDINGSVNSPIVFKALGDSVLINQSGPLRDDGINIENADYIVIDGFISNDMPGAGNGIRLVNADHCVVRNCSCDNNAERGIFTGFTDDILIEYNLCTNSIDEHGIYVSNSSDRPIIRYNECYGNNAIGIHMNGDLSEGGDGIISDAEIYGNIIHDNNHAAGINMDGLQDPVVYNNLIYNNHIAQGIALFQGDGAIPTRGAKIYNNTIIVPSDGRWGILVNNGSNVNTEIYNNIIINQHAWRGCITIEDTSQFKSDYNVLNNKMSSSGDGSTISLAQWQGLGLDIHSQLADALSAIFMNPDSSDYQLISGSQAIDTGTAMVSAVVAEDLNGDLRPSGEGYDIGAYEFLAPCVNCWTSGTVVYVDSAAVGMQNGTSWVDGFIDLQEAIAAVSSFPQIEEIWIANGTYRPGNDSLRNMSFVLVDSIVIYGGFAGGEALLAQRNPLLNRVRLSGDIGLPGDSEDNSFHVVIIDATCVGCLLDGVTITQGNSNGVPGIDDRGAAILSFGKATLHNVLIEENMSSGSGAAIFNTGEQALLITDQCLLRTNTSNTGQNVVNESGASMRIRNIAIIEDD